MIDERPSGDFPSRWMMRLPEVFDGMEGAIGEALGVRWLRRLGRDYRLAGLDQAAGWRDEDALRFIRWKIPVDHSWPCDPAKIEGFIEKAAQALAGKFGQAGVQAVMVGALDPSQRYFRLLASNLRGRLLQLLPEELRGLRDAEMQDPQQPTLFCLVGQEGLFAGIASPRLANGFYPGGTRFIAQSANATISRAGAKLAEALHYLRLHRKLPLPGSHWLELGASPGGMTAELLRRGFRVTAIDRAALDPRLASAPGLEFVQADAGVFVPPAGTRYDAILSDLNGDAAESMARVLRMAGALRPDGLVIFTLKVFGEFTLAAIQEVELRVTEMAAAVAWRRVARTHLSYNRHEFTLFFSAGSAD